MNKVKLTVNQQQLMEHTISDPGRNYFLTSKGSDDALEFDRLVDMGFAETSKAPSWTESNDVLYRLTRAGRIVITKRIDK